MHIITAPYIYTPKGFQKDLAIAFEDSIEKIDTLEALTHAYPHAVVESMPPSSILYPGFINSHVHLEFSANQTSLEYGEFMPWLHSVIEHREALMEQCDNSMMHKACETMMRSGVTSFGAISSFGNELEVCEKTPQRVVFFNELIGSNAQYADMLYSDFLERLKVSSHCPASSRITPAIAIHSPYAVHPILLQKAVTIAKEQKLPLSAHFLESSAEREWLVDGTGAFKPFFKKYFNTTTPVNTIQEFMYAFDTYPTHFTHCTQTNEVERDYLAQMGHSIAHCPRSNRYLGCGILPIESLTLPFSVATDGLSSNESLNIFDELRSALMLHHQLPLTQLSDDLIRAVTSTPAKILGLGAGEIAEGKVADFAVITLPQATQKEEQLALWSILHTKEVSQLYIAGKRVL